MLVSCLLHAVFFPAAYLASAVFSTAGSPGKRKQAAAPDAWPQLFVLAAMLLQPTLVLTDHGHFQYNCISLGLSALAATSIARGQDLLGSVLFSLALNHKQMSLFFAPAFFAHLLGKCLQAPGVPQKVRRGWDRLLQLALHPSQRLAVPAAEPSAHATCVLPPNGLLTAVLLGVTRLSWSVCAGPATSASCVCDCCCVDGAAQQQQVGCACLVCRVVCAAALCRCWVLPSWGWQSLPPLWCAGAPGSTHWSLPPRCVWVCWGNPPRMMLQLASQPASQPTPASHSRREGACRDSAFGGMLPSLFISS